MKNSSGFHDFYNLPLDVSHITNAIRHNLYKIQTLLWLFIAVYIHTIQSTYTFTKVCYWREPFLSLETIWKFGK